MRDMGEKIVISGVIVLGAFTIFLIIMSVVCSIKDGKKYDGLMAQCIADGNKEYECVSFLRSNSHPASHSVMPIMIRR